MSFSNITTCKNIYKSMSFSNMTIVKSMSFSNMTIVKIFINLCHFLI